MRCPAHGRCRAGTHRSTPTCRCRSRARRPWCLPTTRPGCIGARWRWTSTGRGVTSFSALGAPKAWPSSTSTGCSSAWAPTAGWARSSISRRSWRWAVRIYWPLWSSAGRRPPGSRTRISGGTVASKGRSRCGPVRRCTLTTSAWCPAWQLTAPPAPSTSISPSAATSAAVWPTVQPMAPTVPPRPEVPARVIRRSPGSCRPPGGGWVFRSSSSTARRSSSPSRWR